MPFFAFNLGIGVKYSNNCNIFILLLYKFKVTFVEKDYGPVGIFYQSSNLWEVAVANCGNSEAICLVIYICKFSANTFSFLNKVIDRYSLLKFVRNQFHNNFYRGNLLQFFCYPGVSNSFIFH